MRSRRPSIGLRLTVLFAAASTSILLALGILVGRSVEQHFVEQDMEMLTGKLRLAANLLAKLRQADDLRTLPDQIDDSLVGHHGLLLQVTTADGRILYSTPHTAFPDVLRAHAPVDVPTPPAVWMQDGHEGAAPHRGIAARLATGIPEVSRLWVGVGVDISHHQQFMASFRRTLWLFVGGSAVVVGLLGWFIVRRSLAPLGEIRAGAAAVTASRLDYRIALDAVPAELSDLALALNQMLARLEDSFRRLKDFSSDLAHELRTPISNLMTQTQVALSSARSAEQYRDILASNAEEFDRLARMIADMLFLAQADHGLIVPNRESVRLDAEVGDLFDFFDALAEDKAVHLVLHGAATVTGDRLMLRRALANLLSNAIRHCPRDGDVTVDLADGSDGVTIAIGNAGAPIPAEHAARIFDRFYRADPSRHGGGEGAGLGLAITQSIVLAHQGTIAVDSGDGRVSFVVRMPAR